MAGETVRVEILCSVITPAGAPERAVGRDAEGRLFLLERRRGKDFAIASRAVSVDLASRTAGAVLAGDANALTWSETPRVLALALASILFPTPEPADLDPPPREPAGAPDAEPVADPVTPAATAGAPAEPRLPL